MKGLATRIYAAARSGDLAEPFKAAMVKRACPGMKNNTYSSFLSNHAEGNPNANTELFVRVRPGSYRRKDGRLTGPRLS
jgi:hypothetical protein